MNTYETTATVEEQGLVRVAYSREDHDTVLQTLADRISPRVLHAPRGSTRPRGVSRPRACPRRLRARACD